MTATREPPDPASAEPGSASRSSRRRDGSAVLEVCPLLAADGGAWRSAYAARQHRCHAVQPPALLAIDKQRQLCLVPAHQTCATFVAARAVAADAVPAGPGESGARLWSASPAAPLVLEPARRTSVLTTSSARRGGQAALVVLMVVAFAVLVIARTQTPSATAGPTPGGEPTPAVSLVPSVPPSPTSSAASPAATSSAAPSATPGPSPSDSAAPSASAPAASTTYRVKSGDTLSTIAARFGTTVKALSTLNGITDPRRLHIGQVLRIP